MKEADDSPNKKKDPEKNLILRMTSVALFSALAFVLTLYARIPYFNGEGYFNFGDIITLLAALALGPIEGAFVGMLSGSLADLFAGAGAFLPWTLAAKALLGGLSGLFFRLWKNKKILRYSGVLIGSLAMVAVYFFSYWLYFGIEATINSGFDLLQGLGCSIVAIALHLALEKTGILKRFAR